jgi:uncharacterized protein (TIGR00661 family)
MKILYAIQGTGNGHLSRAKDIIPVIKKYFDTDIFISGAQAEVTLPYPIKYRSKGLSFYFGKKGGIDFLKTFQQNSSTEFLTEIKKFPVRKYDLVINDFEPISAWAAQQHNVPCIALSHQSALLSKKVPKPRIQDPLGEMILRKYAPSDKQIAFHFKSYDKHIYTPVIRLAIREASVQDKGHYTVYLPAYDDKKLVILLGRFTSINWHIFSKHVSKPYHIGKISVYPIRDEDFVLSMATSSGVLCGAGFETPAEALFMNKKLLVVPMQNQYEQHCNAASLKDLKVPVIKKLKKNKLHKIEDWLDSGKCIKIDYPDVAALAVNKVFELFKKM